MRMIPLGRAFPAILAFTLAILANAGAAEAQGVAADPAWLATSSADLHSAANSAFTLIEHKARQREFDEARTETASQLWQPISTAPSTGPSYRRPGSSAARDRVIIHITAAESRHGLPVGLLDALVAAESSYRSDAVSKAGAAGLAQLMPATARSLGVLDRFDIRANLDGGARYLRSMIDQFGSIAMALAAYNAGPGAVTRARGIPRNGETPDYVDRVLRHWRSLWR
jgi:soluble lytic murein transglycosylase-like protein